MIQEHKQKMIQNIHPANEFDKFLKLRSQKQSIIHSQTQSIAQKVLGFQQLLKLTKTGQSIVTTHIISKKPSSHKGQEKTGSSRNIEEGKKYVEENQTDQTQLKKLNKMVYGVTEWQGAKETTSHFNQKTQTTNPKHNIILKKQRSAASQQIKQRTFLSQTCSTYKNPRKFYSPFPQSNYLQKNQRIQRNSNNRTLLNLHYPQGFMKKNLFNDEKQHFSQLRQQIKVLQNKAKKQYGLVFEKYSKNDNKKVNLYKSQNKNDQKQNYYSQKSSYFDHQNDQNYDQFQDLQLGQLLSKQYSKKYYNYSQFNQRNGNDSSIPKDFINVIHNNLQSNNFRTKNTPFDRLLKKPNNKLKKGNYARPKSFIPTCTYVRV